MSTARSSFARAWGGFAVAPIIDALLSGLLTGGIYALMASGLTLIFGVLEIVNVAQGILVILGAYLSYALYQYLHIDIFLGLLITMPVMFVLGLGIEWAFIRRLKQDPSRIMLSVLVMFAVALIIEGALNLIFTPDLVTLHASYIDASWPIAGFYLPYVYVFSFILSVALLIGLYFLVYRTQFGYSLRASMQNRTAAALIGIDVRRVSAITFAIGVALTAAGGMAYGATNLFNAASSYDLISRLLVIIVLGGLGSLSGALFAVYCDLYPALCSSGNRLESLFGLFWLHLPGLCFLYRHWSLHPCAHMQSLADTKWVYTISAAPCGWPGSGHFRYPNGLGRFAYAAGDVCCCYYRYDVCPAGVGFQSLRFHQRLERDNLSFNHMER